MQFDDCHAVYNGLTDRFGAQIERLASETEKEISAASIVHGDVLDDQDIDGETGRTKAQELELLKSGIAAKRTPKIDSLKRLAGSVWVNEMKFSRRAEGREKFRAVFARARKSPHVVWQAFEASGTRDSFVELIELLIFNPQL